MESATRVVDLSRGDPSFVLRNEGSEERLKGNHSVLRVRSYFLCSLPGFLVGTVSVFYDGWKKNIYLLFNNSAQISKSSERVFENKLSAFVSILR